MFWGQVRGLADEGRTVFFTTHYMEEAEVADRIALIDSGRIVALGTPSELKARVGGGVVTLRTDDDAGARAWLKEHGFTPEPGGQGDHDRPRRIPPPSCRTSCGACRCGSSGRRSMPRAWRTCSSS
jgi:ABC-type multidrug transport system ATPase subunit